MRDGTGHGSNNGEVKQWARLRCPGREMRSESAWDPRGVILSKMTPTGAAVGLPWQTPPAESETAKNKNKKKWGARALFVSCNSLSDDVFG